MGGLVTLITKDKIDIDVVTSPTNIIITMSTAIGRCDTCKQTTHLYSIARVRYVQIYGVHSYVGASRWYRGRNSCESLNRQ